MDGARKLEVTIRNGGDVRELHISVADNGVGIRQEKWLKVTQRGVRADEQQPGQGIGLAVVLDIVESYGGTVSAAPSDLGGTEIKVTL